MNDQILMNTALTFTKNMCEILMHGAIESEKKINKTFSESLQKFIELQQDIFEEMQNKGFYKLENVTESKITKAKTKHETKMD